MRVTGGSGGSLVVAGPLATPVVAGATGKATVAGA